MSDEPMQQTEKRKPRTGRPAGAPRGDRRRDRAATKQRLIDAVGSVLERDGVLALGINSIAKRANVDKVLIYRYFSNLNGLFDAYAAKTRLWPDLADVAGDAPAVFRTLAPIDRLTLVLGNLAEALARRPRSLDIAAWRVLETNALTEALAAQQATLNRQILDLAFAGSALTADNAAPRLAMIIDAVIMDVLRAHQSESPPALGSSQLQDLTGRLFGA